MDHLFFRFGKEDAARELASYLRVMMCLGDCCLETSQAGAASTYLIDCLERWICRERERITKPVASPRYLRIVFDPDRNRIEKPKRRLVRQEA